MPWFCQNAVFFCQNAVDLRFHKNILFLISIIWSLLCEFNTEYLPFLCLCYQSPCALLLTGGICDRDVNVVCILRGIYIFLHLKSTNFSKLAAIWTAVIFATFTKVCRVFCPFFRDFLVTLTVLVKLSVLSLYGWLHWVSMALCIKSLWFSKLSVPNIWLNAIPLWWESLVSISVL